MAPATRGSSSASAAKRKGSRGGSAKAAATPPQSKVAKRAATSAANKAKDRELATQDDASDGSSEVDEESGDKDSGGDDGTGSSSSSGSDISEDTMALVKQIDDRRAAKKRKLAGKSTAVVTASAAKTSVDKAARKALRNDASVAKEKRKKSRATLGRIIAKIGTGKVAEKAGLKISGLPKARKATSSKKDKRKALSSPDQSSADETDDLVEVPAVPVGTIRISKQVDKLINWLALSTLTHLPTPIPTFAHGPAHAYLPLVYTSSLLELRGKINPRVRPNYVTYLVLLEVVQRFLPQLFSSKLEALPVANLHVCDIMAKIKGELDEAILSVDGQQDLIDFTFATFLIDLRASGDAFQPVASVIKSMASLSTSVLNKKTKTTINAAYSGAQGFSPAVPHRQQHPQQQQQQQQQRGGGRASAGMHRGAGRGGGQNGQQRPPPPPPGLPGMVWLGSYGAWCRKPYDGNGNVLQHGCVRCGAGSIAPNAGHHGTNCQATSAEKADWLQHARAVR
jgi:hypothetical protein